MPESYGKRQRSAQRARKLAEREARRQARRQQRADLESGGPEVRPPEDSDEVETAVTESADQVESGDSSATSRG